MRGNYISPSELLQAQRETGKSYWDLIGQPLTPAVGYNINNPYSESEKSYKQWYNTDAKQTTQLDTKTSNDLVLNELILKYNNLLASMNKPKELKEYEYDDLPSFRKGKDKFTSFAQRLGPKIYKEMNKRGVYSDAAYDNVMRQLAMESSYGLSDVALKNHNYGGVGFNGKTYFNYKNDDAFVKDYIRMMKSKYGAALKAKNTTQYAKALKSGGYYQDSLENYTNKLNAMSSMSAAAKRHRLLNPKMYEYLVLLSDMEEPAVSTRVEKPINKEPIVNTTIQTEAPLIPKPEYLESNSLIRKSFALNMNNMLLGREFLFNLPGFKKGKETIYPLGKRYWLAYSNTPTILLQKNAWVTLQKEQKDRDVKAFRKYIKTEGQKELNKEVKDYLTTSNATTWTTSNKNPKNPHLQDRVIKGAKAHAAWEKEHPVLNTWGTMLGAVPFAVAAYPLAATAGSGIAALGDAAAATSAGQAITAGLTPLTTAASTSVAGAPLYTWADAGLSSLFGAHGIQTAIDEGGISPETALEIAPLVRLAKPMWDAGKQGLQYTTKAIDNATRYASPSYDLYRTVGETTPSVRVRDPYVNVKGLNGADKSYIKIKSSLENLADAKRGNKNEAYYLFAPKDIDILKLRNARFGNGKAYDGPILGSGSVDGKFVSYGEPWMEFAPSEKTALYEMPTGPRRGPNLMATDFRGNRMDYSVNEAYNAVLRDRQFHQDIKNMELGDILPFKRDNYPDLIGGIPTDIYHANQTVIPNKNWNFDKFLKTPLWKYFEDPVSGQVQKELMMKWPEAKPLETPTIEWADAANTTPKVTHFYHGSPVRFDAFSADFIGSGEGGSKVMRGINLWPEEKIANAPKFANIKSPDAPLHLGVSNTPLGGELNPTVYDVSGRGLKLYTTTPRGVKGLNQSDLISQGYDGIQTPNQVTVFPESIGKLSIDKQSTIDEFILSHPEVEKWNPWTTDTQKMQNIIDMSKMSKWTPEQWTAAQDAAIAKGDMAEAQRLRDLHFKVSAPKTEIVDINGNPHDIRYGLLPFGVGLTGYGLFNNHKKSRRITLK